MRRHRYKDREVSEGNWKLRGVQKSIFLFTKTKLSHFINNQERTTYG